MQTRTLGHSGIELTTVGLGTWAIGGGDWAFAWGPQDDALSAKTIHAALDAGINWIDTAPVYGLGHAEEVVGAALRERSDCPFVATKCGRVWDDQGRVGNGLGAASVRVECEDSLRRLGVDVIDLYQIHWPIPDEQVEEAWQTVAELIEEGKVRFGGVSNFSVSQLERAMRIHPVTSLQPPYSMFERTVEDGALAFCEQHDIGVVAYSPMQKGLLTGKVTLEWMRALPMDDHRRRDPMFRGPRLAELLGRVDQLKQVADRLGVPLSQLAIAWVLRRSEVTSAIVGARRPGQILETFPAMNVELALSDLDEIAGILE